MKNTTSGFTLIELLIVIAIIGILAAVLIPNLLGARSRAYDAAAQACAREIQTKEEIYQIDNNKYAALANLKGDYLPKCDAAIMTVGGDGTPSQASNATLSVNVSGTGDTSFSGSVKHPQGKKTFIVTPNSLSGS